MIRRPRRTLVIRRCTAPLLVILAAGFVLAGCGSSGKSKATGTTGGGGPLGGNAEVILKDISFKPSAVTIKVGGTVTWTWKDGSTQHNVVFDDFKSELQSDGSFDHTFDSAGTFSYVCAVHPQMKGKVVVTT